MSALYLSPVVYRILTLQPIAALLRTVSGCSISHSSSSSSSSSSNPGDEPTTHGDGGHCGDADSITYEHAVVGAPGQRPLLGTPTYQLTHHPHYKRALNNPIFKPLYLQTVCGQQFTRLVRNRVDDTGWGRSKERGRKGTGREGLREGGRDLTHKPWR